MFNLNINFNFVDVDYNVAWLTYYLNLESSIYYRFLQAMEYTRFPVEVADVTTGIHTQLKASLTSDEQNANFMTGFAENMLEEYQVIGVQAVSGKS